MTDLAKRTAPQGRPPTSGELWSFRALCAQDSLTFKQRSEYAHLMHEILRVLGQPSSCGRPNPHYRNRRRWRKLWTEVGELLGVGPPPWRDELLELGAES